MLESNALVNNWLKQIQPDLGMAEDGTCAVTFGGDLDMVLEVTEDGEHLVFYIMLDPLPVEPSYQLLTWALARNLHQGQTRGGCLAFDPANGFLIFSYRHLLGDLNETLFINLLGNVLETGSSLRRLWRDALAGEAGHDNRTGCPDQMPDWALQA